MCSTSHTRIVSFFVHSRYILKCEEIRNTVYTVILILRIYYHVQLSLGTISRVGVEKVWSIYARVLKNIMCMCAERSSRLMCSFDLVENNIHSEWCTWYHPITVLREWWIRKWGRKIESYATRKRIAIFQAENLRSFTKESAQVKRFCPTFFYNKGNISRWLCAHVVSFSDFSSLDSLLFVWWIR